jgi:hypothetical protein
MTMRFLPGAILALFALTAPAAAYKFDVPGGVCPKDPKVQCAVKCDNGNVADYMKWTGTSWGDLIGRVKDPDMNGEARKLVAKSNQQNVAMGGKADCK